jgi:quercetin dioxygenase-like cupin family protein
MAIHPLDELPRCEVPRITTRVLAGAALGATTCEVWQQWMTAGQYIPLHYHTVEEVLVLLRGTVEMTLGQRRQEVTAPASIIVPPHTVHGMEHRGDQEVELLAFFPVIQPGVYAPDGTLTVLAWQEGA